MSNITNNASHNAYRGFTDDLENHPVIEFKEVFEVADQYAQKYLHNDKERKEFDDLVTKYVADRLEVYKW
jgi:hypothetical protein